MAEVLHGNASGNQLNATTDKSQVYGLAGNDTLTADGKSDVLLVGGSGDDSLIMSGGNGTLAGGAGKDTFELTYSATKKLSAIIEDLDTANDKIIVNFDGNTVPQITSSTTTDGNVILRDNSGNFNVTLKGVRDNDYLDSDTSDEAWEVLELTNIEREADGKSPLTMADGLTEGAQIRAEEITAQGNLGVLENHTRPDGTPYYTVLDGKYNYPGENLDGGATSPAQVVGEWIGSDSHRKNILDDRFQKLGVGYSYSDEDPSDLRYYWTQLFADSLNNPETVSTANLLTANISTDTVSKFVTLTDNPDTYSNSDYGATIDAKGGNDSISNSGLLVSISGGNDNDTIDNRGSFTTINAGGGNDLIRLDASTKEVLIQYTGGNDTVSGLNSTDTVSISGSSFTPVTLGSDIIVSVGTDSITLANAANLGVQINGTRSKLYILTEGNDSLENTIDGATITALGGNDSITNDAMKVSINGGKDDDTIRNFGDENVTIDGDDGNNYIINNGKKVTITGGKDDDTVNTSGDSVIINLGDGVNSVRNSGASVLIDLGAGNDTVWSYGVNSTIRSGAGDDDIWINSDSIIVDSGAGVDVIHSFNSNVSIYGGANNDDIYNSLGAFVTMDGGDGDDSISNEDGNFVIMYGGAGNDSLYNSYNANFVTIYGGTGHDFIGTLGDSVAIYGGVGVDSILSNGANVTINGGQGNDTVMLTNSAQNNLLEYTAGDGNDTISGFNSTSKIEISGASYSLETIGGNVIVNVDAGSITLLDAANLSTVNINGAQNVNTEKIITLTEGNDTYQNTVDGATIAGLGGDDSINNGQVYPDVGYDSVSISGGAGNDYISNLGTAVTVSGDEGSDTLSNMGNYTFADGDAGNDVIWNTGYYSTLNGGEGDDSISNTYSSDVTIDGGAGNDFLSNTRNASLIAMNGGTGDDSIENYGGANVSINGGTGNDLIILSSGAENNLIEYFSGHGNDTISGFNSTDTLNILSGEYFLSTVGNDVIVLVGANLITLLDAASLSSVNITGTQIEPEDRLITLTEGDDVYENTILGARIEALDGNDSIRNYASNVSVNGNNDNDTITNNAAFVTIDGGVGDDYIISAENSSISGGAGNDDIYNNGDSATIDCGDDDDYVLNYGSNVSINGGDGSDSISNKGSNVTIDSGAGKDFISNSSLTSNVSINSGAGDDTVSNYGDSITVNFGDGNDVFYNEGFNVTINGERGDDSFFLVEDSDKNTLIQYATGDGDDSIWGLGENSTIGIAADSYSTATSGNNVIITVDDGSITLVNARNKPIHIIIGESGTSGGGSNSGNNGGGGSSSGSGDGGRGGNDGGNTSGGTSANEGRGSDASGGRSAVGSAGNQTSTNSNSGGGTVRVGRSRIAVATNISDFMSALTPATQQTTAQSTANQRIYSGGNQIISDYTSGEKIIFGAAYTGSFYDDAGNYCVGSSTGALVIQNSTDKVIDLSDAAGNDFLKAYSATTAGVIDGRGLGGFEIINGSAGSDAIFAGDGGSQLWGGADVASDTMIGGNGTDIFIGGRTQGADVILNASAADIVHLNDASLSDIIATEENNGAIAVAFNTGNAVAVQSMEALSATFMLADGSAYRFNHATRNWQSATN